MMKLTQETSVNNGIELTPLGSAYRDRFWPITEAQLREVEANLGWVLPDALGEHLRMTGLSGVFGIFVSPQEPEGISVSVLFGEHRTNKTYSIVSASEEAEGDNALLRFAVGGSGAFYVAPDGSIHFESNREQGTRPIAASFGDFLEGLQEPS